MASVSLMLLASSCGSAHHEPNVQKDVTVDAPSGAFTKNTKVNVSSVQPPGNAGELIVGPVVRIATETDEQPKLPISLHFPKPKDGGSVSIAYFDEDSGWWIPTNTKVDVTGQLTAQVNHLSIWTEIRDSLIAEAGKAPVDVQNTASWFEYQGGRLLGDRGTPPTCKGELPKWVSGQLITVDDKNAELFACAESVDNELALKIVNNRGYSVTVEFNKPFKTATADLPTSLGDVVQRLSNPGTSTRVFLTPKGSATVVFDQLDAGGVVEGHVRRDAGTMLTTLVFDLASVAGADLPVGGGKTLGLSSVECLATTAKSIPQTAEGVRSTDAHAVEAAALDLDKCVDDVVEGELVHATPGTAAAKRLSSASKFLKALKLFKFEQYALDAFVNDGTPEANLVDVSFLTRPTPKAATATPTLGKVWAPDQSGYGTVRPKTIFNGGDPTGLVSDVNWSSWGDAQATGHGTSDYVADGQSVADGTQETATVVAFDLGTCEGVSTYRAIEWFFPQQGEKFSPNVYINICTGEYVGG